MNNTNNFESFLEKRNDILDGQAYQLLRLLTCPEIEQTETLSEFLWDMAFIGPLLETAESLLQKAGFSTCYPYYGENEIPCFQAGLRKGDIAPHALRLPFGNIQRDHIQNGLRHGRVLLFQV